MSKADAISFVERFLEDEALRERVTEAGKVSDIASELGLEVTDAEFQEVVARVDQEVNDRELSDDALDAVAGGAGAMRGASAGDLAGAGDLASVGGALPGSAGAISAMSSLSQKMHNSAMQTIQNMKA